MARRSSCRHLQHLSSAMSDIDIEMLKLMVKDTFMAIN